jgi:hypothetical protein
MRIPRRFNRWSAFLFSAVLAATMMGASGLTTPALAHTGVSGGQHPRAENSCKVTWEAKNPKAVTCDTQFEAKAKITYDVKGITPAANEASIWAKSCGLKPGAKCETVACSTTDAKNGPGTWVGEESCGAGTFPHYFVCGIESSTSTKDVTLECKGS